jgi:hypothetical protein
LIPPVGEPVPVGGPVALEEAAPVGEAVQVVEADPVAEVVAGGGAAQLGGTVPVGVDTVAEGVGVATVGEGVGEDAVGERVGGGVVGGGAAVVSPWFVGGEDCPTTAAASLGLFF